MALANRDFAISVSDRRLTLEGAVFDDEYNKSAMWFLEDARIAVSFTGIAKLEDEEDAHKWLLGAMEQAAYPDALWNSSLYKLRDLLTQKFARIQRPDKRFSVLFTGFPHLAGAPLIGTVSNWQKLDGEFVIESGASSIEFTMDARLVVFAGALSGTVKGVSLEDKNKLVNMLRTGISAEAVLEKAFDTMRKASDNHRSKNTINKQMMGIVIPANPQEGTWVRYDSATPQTVSYGVSSVESGPSQSIVKINPEIRLSQQEGADLLVAGPRPEKNAPCWCGSKKPYRLCHRNKPSLSITVR